MAAEILESDLRELTTIKVGGSGERIIRVTTESELVSLIAQAQQSNTPVIVVGGGSNIVFSDSDFPGWVIVVATTGMQWRESNVRVSAGEDWDQFVVSALERGYGAFAPLAGIPGTVGATPIQNIGAYGIEIADLIESITVLDRESVTEVELLPHDCDFGYRTSVFKKNPDRYLVLAVTYSLQPATEITVQYQQLAGALGVEIGSRVPAAEVRESVLRLRGMKSMVVDQADADSNSTGSFFINPTVLRELAPTGCPSYALKSGDPRVETHVKLSAAWLIENAGIIKGFALPGAQSNVRVSRNHSLAIANPDSGNAADVIALASYMRQAVFNAFGIELDVEPVLVNCELEELIR
jgi:UDP-N-acetylmuramate dehydrogenase